jgi:hypothetical protein
MESLNRLEPESKEYDISVNAVYSKFVDGEKQYGHVDSLFTKLHSRLNILRVNSSRKAAAKAYNFNEEIDRKKPFYSDASITLFTVCDYKHVKYYQIGELLKCKANPNVQLDETGDTALHRLIRNGGNRSNDMIMYMHLLD